MVSPQDLFRALTERDITFFAGIPDSLLRDFCAYIADHVPISQHVICANEGAAVALATGNYLATHHPGLVYMQNSGFGNAINPLLSMTDRRVYSIPLLLLVGWRGELGTNDEPQHITQGRIMLPLLEMMGIPHEVINRETVDIETIVSRLHEKMLSLSCTCALVVRAGAFMPYRSERVTEPGFSLSREEAIHIILDNVQKDAVVVGTTGMTSREIFEYREKKGQGHEKDFLTIGSMGHASQIALGIASVLHDREVYCLDGDGAVIMHMGSLAINGTSGLKNFRHVVINNGAHDSVGGQSTAGFDIDLPGIALACRYKNVARAETRSQVIEELMRLRAVEGPSFLEIRVNRGARKDLGRPTISPAENKKSLMNFLKK